MATRQSRSLDAEQFEHTTTTNSQVSGLTPNDSSSELELDPRSVHLSEPFLGRWAVLVSTTNWEKGKIICDWRAALKDSGSNSSAISDEAWSRQAGGVTPQHVGRLRRVYDRFSGSHRSFPKLYWSHFLAAIDWDDAEMWLEGAAQSRWSVAQMRRTRWEATGADPLAEPADADIISASQDEDFIPTPEADSKFDDTSGPREIAEGPRPDGPDFGDEDSSLAGPTNRLDDDAAPWEDVAVAPQESPFAKLPSMPVDLADALEQFKLAIIRHRADGWREVSKENVIQVLDALRAFASL